MFLAPSVCLWANHAVSIFVLYPLSGSWLTKAAGFKGFHSASCPSNCSLFLYLCRLQGVEGKHLGTKEFIQISTEHPVKSIQNHTLCSISLCLTQLKSSSLVDRELKSDSCVQLWIDLNPSLLSLGCPGCCCCCCFGFFHGSFGHMHLNTRVTRTQALLANVVHPH